jgi:hypothetical protein
MPWSGGTEHPLDGVGAQKVLLDLADGRLRLTGSKKQCFGIAACRTASAASTKR